MDAAFVLIFIPVLAALVVLMLENIALRYLVVFLTFLVISLFSLRLFFNAETVVYNFSHFTEWLVIILDVLLLLFFAQQGFLRKNSKIAVLALFQLLLYGIAEWFLPAGDSESIIIDDLSKVMFLIINIVGGIIVLYAVKYMEYENTSPFRKKLFIAYLLIFLSIMNLVVMANNILLFFFLFELTTLASYVLIGFRKDEIGIENSSRALWMNQVGGVAILLGALAGEFWFGTAYFDKLLLATGNFVLVPIAFLSMAAFVKGAAMPFDSWLLGAMAAPTPVSAMLHSATMVKIAPFMILKFSPVLAGTLLGGVIASAGGLVFVAASYFSLSRDVFKEILGYSTIAMLGLMVMMAAIGTEESVYIAMILMIFHAVSKALLFLTAGVLEKSHHLKNISDMGGLVHFAGLSVLFMMIGFMSLVLPPFGAFMGKLFAIEAVAAELAVNVWLVVPLLCLTIGSVLLTLVYFKIVSAVLSKRADVSGYEKEKMPSGFSSPLFMLLFFLLALVLLFYEIEARFKEYLLVIPLILGALAPLLIHKVTLGFDRAKEYHCGEKEEFEKGVFYFEPTQKTEKKIYLFFTLLFVSIGVGGFIS